MTSQVGLLLIQYLKIKCRSGVTGQNKIKLVTLMKQDERNSQNIKYFVAIATFWVRAFIN